MTDRSEYKLCGYLELFQIKSGFVTPVFEYNHNLFVEVAHNNIVEHFKQINIDHFGEVTKDHKHSIQLSIGDEAIYAFKYNSEIFYGNGRQLSVRLDEVHLDKEISGFVKQSISKFIKKNDWRPKQSETDNTPIGFSRKNETIELLNDLITINNDRIGAYEEAIVGYEKAFDEIQDAEFSKIFRSSSEESKQNAEQLTNEVIKLGGKQDASTTNSGKIYRAWLGVKFTFSGRSLQSIIENCEFGEDAAQKAYDIALQSELFNDTYFRQLIENQKVSLQRSWDILKKYHHSYSSKTRKYKL